MAAGRGFSFLFVYLCKEEVCACKDKDFWEIIGGRTKAGFMVNSMAFCV